MRRTITGVLGLVVLAATALGGAPSALAAPASDARGPVAGPVPKVSLITGGAGTPSVASTSFDLGPFGYTEEEFLVAGTATAYGSAEPLTSNGKWTLTPGSTAPYATRIVVIRPTAAAKFSGSVYQEWLNVSAGFDSAPSWSLAHLELLREGAVWVGVSAQAVGVQGGQSTVAGVQAGGLKGGDPARYGALDHPGDSYSYDLFTQVARAVRASSTTKVLGALVPKRVVATGESQSATRLVTYVDGIQPLTRAFDGFLIHSRFGSAAAVSQAPLPAVPAPVPTFIRPDVGVPVLQFETETDVGPLGFAVARQKDTPTLRTWEVAGTAHADAYSGSLGFGDVGDGSVERALLDYSAPSRGPLNCSTPVNSGLHYAVLMAAYHHFDAWVRGGAAPPVSPQIAVTEGAPRLLGPPGSPTVPSYVITRDPEGNAVGGIRTPVVDAARAVVSGDPNDGGSFCTLFGKTIPFGVATVSEKFPSRAAYVQAFTRSARKAAKAGFLLAPEVKRLEAAAGAVPFPGVS